MLTKLASKLTFDLAFNFCLILIFIFSKNYLEEDLIIGLFSSMVLFFLFFSLKELKAEQIRQLRLKIKKVYRIQKKLLTVYYFFYATFLGRTVKYTKKITSKHFEIKLDKIFIKTNLKLKNFLSKLIFIKIYYLNLIVNLVFNFNLRNFNIVSN